MDPHPEHSRPWRRAALTAGLLLVSGWFMPAASAATGTCGAATGQGTGPADYPTYCWIDFTNYNNALATGTGGQAFTITLPGGSTLSFTLTVSGGGLNAVTVPTWTGAAFGQTAFTGVPGNPALYQTTSGTTTNVSLSNIVLTVGSGTVPYALVAADAESTNNGESLSFTTNGNPWTLLATMPQGGVYPTLSGVGTATVTETGVAGTVGAYAFATQGSPTTISSVLVGGGLQGIAFAVKFHAVDLAITSTQSGGFAAGGTGTYTLAVSSNGPDTYSPSNTITVTDTLPTGLSYASASGSGWSCGDVGQVVTCTVSNVTLASGGSLPNITLNVTVANTIANTVTNTATVASNPNLDFNTANNTATNTTGIVEPDLTNSTKTVSNTTGGDAVVGSTLKYTITLTESAGAVAAGVSVVDDVPANLSGFTVTSFPGGATNSSTGAGTGANGDGQVNITNITVPANGSVTIVFTAQVAAGTANCTNIDNTATITNPNGSTTTITPSAPTIIVAQSQCASSGNKVLYVYDNLQLTRTPQTANGAGVTINGGNAIATWTLTPAIATGKSLVLPAQTVTVVLICQATNQNAGTNRAVTVQLLNGATSLGTSPSVNCRNGPATHTFSVAIGASTIAAGSALKMVVKNTNATAGNHIAIFQMTATTGATTSTITFATTTVINVDSVTTYNATYSATTTQTVFPPSQTGKTETVYICAVISDPFGSYDVDPATNGTAPQITITDPNGVVQLSAATMNLNGGGGKDCSGTANAAVNSYEYAYTLPVGGTLGFWTTSVTGFEGTEGTISHTANGSFDVDVPSLLVMKSVSAVSDPVEGATRPKSIPGAVMLYTVQVQNTGRGAVDSGTLAITDPVPVHTAFDLTGATPFTFTDGSTASGLSAPVMTFSNNGGSTYVYSPSCTRPCTDSAITNFKISFTGSMNSKLGASAPSFTLTYQVVIQ